MREFSVAQAKSKLLVIVVDEVNEIMSLDAQIAPWASDALAYLESGGEFRGLMRAAPPDKPDLTSHERNEQAKSSTTMAAMTSSISF